MFLKLEAKPGWRPYTALYYQTETANLRVYVGNDFHL